MPFFVIGLNHHSAPLVVREKLAVAAAELGQLLQALMRDVPSVREVALLSTCNRMECYLVGSEAQSAWNWLCAYRGVEARETYPFCFEARELDGVRHLFRVASGLDSMVLGETQITGQFKAMLKIAQAAGTLGKHLNHLLQQALAVAKEVRSRTQIGAHVISMAAAAVRLSERVFGPVSEQAVLFLGAGEMIELCLTHFAGRGPRRAAVLNRTLARAEALASRFGAEAYALEQLPALLHEFDTLVASTASPLPLVGLGLVARALKARRHKPLVIVDLAVPRNVEPEVAELDDVFLYSVDDLAELVREGHERRAEALADAEAIVEAHVARFAAWARSLDTVMLIRRLREHVELLAAQERERALARLRAGADPEVVLKAFSHALTQKWLHAPSTFLAHAPSEALEALRTWIPQMMGLSNEERHGD